MKIRKFLAVAAAGVIGLSSMGAQALIAVVSASEVQSYDDFDYTVRDDGTTELTGYHGSDTEITIPDGVTSIGDEAFQDCISLTEINIPNSVTSIGYEAFSGCTSLTDITIPDGVTSIGSWAFEDCTSLTEITIPDGVTSIGGSTFYGCTSLTEITIPDSVTSIGDNAFDDCTSLTEITIPDGVTSIGGSTFFGCTSLTEITILDGVTSIGDMAFWNCTSLTDIAVPNSVTSIGDDAFYNTAWLENQPDGAVYAGKVFYSYKGKMPENAVITLKDGTLGIAGSAFESCSLKEVIIPDSVTCIGDDAFYDCTSLTKITILNPECGIDDIDDGKDTIPETAVIYGYINSTAQDYAAAYDREMIFLDNDSDDFDYTVRDDGTTELTGYHGSDTEITIPDGVTSIGNMAFDDCTSLTGITIPDSVTSIGDEAFSGCTSLAEITIPNSVTSIGDEAFDGCISLTEITIPNSVTSIGEVAFSGCTSLTEITIPDGVTSIGSWAFHDCTNLTEITIPDSVTYIDWGAFEYCTSLTEINIPDGVTSIGDSTFSGCTSLTKITILNPACEIGDNETTIPETAVIYGYTNSTAQDYAAAYDREMIFLDNDYNDSDDFDYTVRDDGTTELTGYHGSDTEITIPDGVTSIGDFAFENCTSLTKVTIPDSVTSIGDEAFDGCRSLTEIAIPNSVTSIGDHAFGGCTNLTEITIPDSVAYIDWGAFEGCTSLTKITILNPACEIGDNETTIPETAVIYGYTNSTAQDYAAAYDREMIFLDNAPVTVSTGDYDNDGEITMKDAYHVLVASSRVSMGMGHGLTDEQFAISDIDGDGTVTMSDAYWILLYSSYVSLGQEITWEELLS